MARADAALDAAAWQLERDLMATSAPGHWVARLTAAGEAPAELLLRVIRRAIHVVVGPRDIRLERLETLTDVLHANVRQGRALRATLAGARIVLGRDGSLRIEPEPPRRRGRAVAATGAMPALELRPI